MSLNIQQPWYSYPPTEAINLLESDLQKGLSQKQVKERIATYGPNEIKEVAGRTKLQILIDQFTNIMLLMLIAVALISGIIDLIALVNNTKADGAIPFKDTIAILFVVILNGVLGYVQESRAEDALAALKQLSSPQVDIVRDGTRQNITAPEVVPGDIMLLEAGDNPCADGILVEASNLQVRESALTGEAQGVNKIIVLEGLAADTSLGDRSNMIFCGTEILNGRAKMLVTSTGMETELGKIAQMIQSVPNEPTPLQQRMTQLGNVLVTGSLVLTAVVIVLGLIQSGWGALESLVEVSLSMAVAVVPESLPAVITVTLALGTQRMVKRNALIRKLSAVETLGSVNTICSDKTGTLTQNKMVVQKVVMVGESFQVTGEGYAPIGEFLDNTSKGIQIVEYPALKALMSSCILCNDASLQQNEQNEWIILGDPTEGALISVAGKAGLEQMQLNAKYIRVGEFPFSSERKRMTIVVNAEEIINSPFAERSYGLLDITKGSAELILERCQNYQKDDQILPLSEDERRQIIDKNNEMALNGLRVLGFAYKAVLEVPPDEEAAESNLVWLGLVAMSDAARPEVKIAMAKCLDAGMRPIMITGDHPLTAKAIGEQLGLFKPGDQLRTGAELEKMSQEELEQEVDDITIYARVSPEHKLRIVRALQKRDNFVAMTGDGVNDAPALKQANIGIAMGITGTDVSKGASDMILLDDNFATIVAATEEGRVVYSNIRRFIKYILGSNVGEVLTLGAAALLGFSGIPLTPLQILWMNLVTDGLPALALAVEPPEPDIMKRTPFSPTESIFARGMGSYIIRIGIVFAIFSTALMFYAYYNHPKTWKTMVFTTLCLAQMGHAIAIRSNSQQIWQMDPFSNPYLLAAVAGTIILQMMLIYVPPIADFFSTQVLSRDELLICVAFSFSMLIWIELEKLFIRLFFKKQMEV